MGQWVVVNAGGIGRTKSVVGPFDSMDDAYKYCDENDKNMQDTNVKSLREP